MKLKDKIALITGAARGLGQATALELAGAGVDIIGIDLQLEDLAATADEVRKLGRAFTALACDISDEPATRGVIRKAAEVNGGFDILINNAGVLPSGPFATGDFDVWRRTIDINLTGLMALTHAALEILVSRPEAHIVNMASVAGKFGSEGVAAYAASKHGVVGFSSALRAELRDTGVGVSWICPSMADTRMTIGVKKHYMTPMVQPRDVARAVRRSIERNAIEVYVPGWVRFTIGVIPAMSPGFARWLSRVTGASESWMHAKKGLGI